MGKQKKSSKDLAFNREREKYRHEINVLKREIQDQQAKLQELHSEIQHLHTVVAEKQDWIERLLEYMDLDENDMKSMLRIEELKAGAEFADKESSMMAKSFEAAALSMINLFGLF